MARLIRFLDDVLDRLALLSFLAAFLVGAYGVYDGYLVYENAAARLSYEQVHEDPEALSELDDGYVAWVRFPGTGIDCPVMQGDTNTEYLTKDPYGDYSLSGSAFLDSRNDPEFLDGYSLVYGHHMEAGAMFGALDDWRDGEFFSRHLAGTLLTKDGSQHALTVLAVLDALGTREELFAPTEVDARVTRSYVCAHATHRNADAPEGRLVAFSTCKYPDSAERTILVCVVTD